MKASNSKNHFETILQDVSKKHGVNVDLLKQLIAYEKTKIHLERRRGAKEKIRQIIEEE